MIVPTVRNDQGKNRKFALTLTLALTALAYALVVLAGVPEMGSQRARYREVDLTELVRMLPKVQEEVRVEEQEEAQSEEEELPERAVEEALPQRSVERIELTDILPQGIQVDLTPNPTPSPSRTASRQPAAGSNPVLRVESSDLGRIGGFEALSGSVPVAAGRSGRMGTGGEATGGLAVAGGTGGAGGLGSGSDFGNGVEVAGGVVGRGGQAAGTAVEVGLKDISSFGSDYAKLEIRELIEWMKKHPGTLPIGVRTHVQYQPPNLSSVVHVKADDRDFELYLMCKESLYEIHIVLVEGSESTYLVDRSFQEYATYLREGVVRRQGDEIVSIQSSQQAAGSDRATEFYSVFLSWWSVAKNEV